jgi:hypothetical protein
MTPGQPEYRKTPPQTIEISYFLIEKSPKTAIFFIKSSNKKKY